MLIVDAEIFGAERADLRCDGGRIAEIGRGLRARPGEDVVDAGGGALLPGLRDHHIHLNALAMEARSVRCGPPQVRSMEELATVLRAAPAADDQGWVRGSGYHESVAGLPDRHGLDILVPDRPLRIQHRSGKLWLLNSTAAKLLRLNEQPPLRGLERDASGHATGRLYRRDDWLRRQLGPAALPDLAPASARLASFGVTAVTDASPANDAAALARMQSLVAQGGMRQRVHLLGGLRLPATASERVTTGAWKLLLDEDRLPAFDRFVARIAAAHRRARPVAVHCVTRTELMFCLAAFAAAGPLPGDRVEHASVCPDDVLPLLHGLGIRVVTQPAFLQTRGDQYARDVPADEQPLLYRARAFLASGVALGGSTDAPYGPDDPWTAMRAAIDRSSASGHIFAPAERLTPEEAFALFASDIPGDRPARLRPGENADLCLLDRPWHQARHRLRAEDVCLTVCAGRPTYQRHSPAAASDSSVPQG